MTPVEKDKLDQQAKLQQMYINTRLVALETALKLMHAPNYNVISYKGEHGTPGSDNVPVVTGGKTDHITLLAMAQEVEAYILGDIPKETQDILDELNKPKPTIVPAKNMPGLRP